MRILVTMCLSLSLVAAYQEASASDTLVVMTQNQYLGADINPVIMAPLGEFLQKAAEALQQVANNNFAERAQALAAEIADWQPDVVNLQEVFDFGCIVGFDPAGKPIVINGPPPFPLRNHLSDTLAALAALGEDYVPVATVNNIDISLPIPLFSCSGIRILDRDVILVRGDHVQDTDKPAPVPFCEGPANSEEDLAKSADGCNYPESDSVFVPSLGAIKRGFVGADVTIRGEKYRFVNTHLEQRDLPSKTDGTVPAQVAQAADLLESLNQTPAEQDRSVIITGDINSSPDDTPFGQIIPPYLQFTGSQFLDAWLLRPGNAPEFTCCQAGDLSNHRSELYERIDMIFTDFLRQGFNVEGQVLPNSNVVDEANDNHFVNCVAAGNGRHGFKILLGDGNHIRHSEAVGNCRDGIEIEAGDENSVINNRAADNGKEIPVQNADEQKTCEDKFGEAYRPWFYAGIDILADSYNNKVINNETSGNTGCTAQSADGPCEEEVRERNLWDENVDDVTGECISTNRWHNNREDGHKIAPECAPGPS